MPEITARPPGVPTRSAADHGIRRFIGNFAAAAGIQVNGNRKGVRIMSKLPSPWLWYKRRPFFVVGLILAIAGGATWLSGWRNGHDLTTLALFVMLCGSLDWKHSLPYGLGVANYYLAVQSLERGDRDEALRLAAKAVKRFRRLADNRPEETWRYASMLDYYWRLLNKAERHQEALNVANLAVGRWRTVAASDPTRTNRLSRAMNRVTTSQDRVDPAQLPAELIEESIDIRRRLVAEEEAYLAGDLFNMSLVHRRNKQWERARPLVQELVALHRRRTTWDPDSRTEVAQGLDVLARILINLDLPTDAVEPALEAVTWWRDLANDDRSRRVHLATALRYSAAVLAQADRPAEARAPLAEALSLCRQLLADGESDPELADLCSDVGTSASRVSLEDALVAHELAITVRRQLISENAAQHAELATDLTNACTVLRRLGRPQDALPLAAEAVAIRRTLAEENTDDRDRLAGALHLLGAVHEDLREFEPALALSEQALEIIESLAADDHDQLHHLMDSLDDHAVLLQRLGRHAESHETEARAQALRDEHDR